MNRILIIDDDELWTACYIFYIISIVLNGLDKFVTLSALQRSRLLALKVNAGLCINLTKSN